MYNKVQTYPENSGHKYSSLMAINCKQLAEIIPLGVNQIRHYARLGIIPCQRLGRHIIFPVKIIEEWLKTGNYKNIAKENPVKASKRIHKK